MSYSPIECIGKFQADVEANGTHTKAEFMVTKGDGEALLSHSLANELFLIQLTNAVFPFDYKEKSPNLFSEKIRKLKDYQLKLHIDESF